MEAQKFLLGSPERGVCVCSVMWEKSLCICCIVTSYQSDLQQEVWDEYNFYVRESDGAPAFESKICTCPSSARCASPDLHPPSLLEDEKNARTLSELDPNKKSSQKSLLFRMHLGREGERRRCLEGHA